VKQLTILVTSDGQWVLEDSDEFLSALGDADPDYDGAMFAVKNLGFIKFQIFDSSIIEIELHPHNVELPALLAVQQQLISTRVKLFRIKFFDNSWKSEIYSSSEVAIARLSELCAPKFAPRREEKFLVEPQNFTDLFKTEESNLRLIAQKWRMSFGHFDPSVISFAIKHNLLSRMMIAGVKPHDRDPVFRFIGDGFNWLANDYQFHGIGERIEDLPDKDYGAWLCNFYRSVAETGQPRYDHVTAAIQVSPTRPKPYVSRYERLLLPWKTPSEEIFVTLSSRVFDENTPAEPSISSEPENLFVRMSTKSS
jgi:hypothetical protein